MLVELADVRRVLKTEKLVPCFQPIVELRTGRLSGFEILARWDHPQFGPILPPNFINLAENNGLIELLMHQILRKAFLSTSLLPTPLTLSFNVLPSQLQNLELPSQVRLAAEAAGFPPTRLKVEVTETALLHNIDRARVIALEFKAMGCRLSLDDFGTGYSSLSHLQALPFDELKIDRTFISSMTDTRESRKIVASTVGLGHSLGLTTIAEGIETEEQADMLLWLGCELGQGWLYGRPCPASQIAALVAAPDRATAATLPAPVDGWTLSSLEALPVQRLAQLQAIYDGAPVGLCFLDRGLRYVSINKRLAEMNGASVAAHMGRTAQQMMPELFPTVEPYLRRALAGEAFLKIEVQRRASTPGKLDWTAQLSYQPVLDEANEVIGISVAVADITDIKRTEASLRESDERQLQSVEFRDLVPWIMDADGNSLHGGTRWVASASLTENPVRNLGWLEPLHADDHDKVMATLAEALRTGKPIDIEYRALTIDGECRWMRSRGSPRFGPSGEIVRWYGSVEELDPRERNGKHPPEIERITSTSVGTARRQATH